MSRAFKPVFIVAGLLMAACLCSGAFASYAVPDENIGTGTIQAVDYVNHTVTVAGHVYRISPKAAYSDNGKNAGVLQPGVKIQFTSNGPVNNPGSRIVNIVVLPPASD
ncbi:MAG: hypothetical protein WCC11_08080 [Gammaproteobacteria bacterium]